MEGYIDENKWIDLSGLPRKPHGDRLRIDWKNSVGCRIQLKYEKINGVLQIDGYEMDDNGNSFVYIVIDKYLPNKTKVSVGDIIYFNLHRFLKHKIIDYAPWMQLYLINPLDAYRYCYSSNKKIDTKCPICGHVATKNISNLYNRGFRCDICDSNISFPNRLMRIILTHLNVNFIPEVGKRHGFSWMQKYLYDFYFHTNDGRNILIEMDGGFHRYEAQQFIDLQKDKLANQNNFHLIRINCMYQDQDKFEYIKNHIICSELSKILPLHTIDWNQCFIDAQKSLFVQVCQMYDNGESISDISEVMKLSKATIHKYLKQGHSIGLCLSYNTTELSKRRKFKYIAQVENDVIIRVFKNANEVEELSDKIYNQYLHKASVRSVCSGHLNAYYGFNFRYISKEEYLQYKMIENNNLQEVV